MIDRLRFLLERPLDPLVARAVVVFATAVLLGFAAVYVLGASEPGRRPAAGQPATPGQPPLAPSFGEANRPAAPPASSVGVRHSRRQDPQDEKGSRAAARAAVAMRSHRALQHIPYRRGRLTVGLVGARGIRAVLAVRAPTSAAARRGWWAFLRRYRDSGRSYIPRFEAEGGHGG